MVPATYYLQAQRVRRWLFDSVMPLFDQVDFLLTPAAAEEPPLGHGGGDNRMNSPWSVVGIPSLTFTPTACQWAHSSRHRGTPVS